MYHGSMEEVKDRARLKQVAVRVYSESHARLFGKITVDVWPITKRAWIMGSNKSFRYELIDDVVAVANKEIVPDGVTVRGTMRAREIAKYYSPEEVCLVCGEFIEQRRARGGVDIPKSGATLWGLDGKK